MASPLRAPKAAGAIVRLAELGDARERARIEGFVAERGGSLFQRPAWLGAVEAGTGQRALGLVVERDGALAGWLPLTLVHSPVFGRALVSSGFAVGGGVLAEGRGATLALARAAEELALRLSCPAVELRAPLDAPGWEAIEGRHAGFVAPLAADDEAQLLAIPRKQRAEIRRSFTTGLEVATGRGEAALAAHHAVYARSVHQLGTPVFPASLFRAMIEAFDADILTISHQGRPVASVLTFYHGGAAMPYWGGGTREARSLRANDRMYFELMGHARRRGCERFDFGRSKTGSGPFLYKKTWGFSPRPLTYAGWSAPGAPRRDADPASAPNLAKAALWRRLPPLLADRIGPMLARSLG